MLGSLPNAVGRIDVSTGIAQMLIGSCNLSGSGSESFTKLSRPNRFPGTSGKPHRHRAQRRPAGHRRRQVSLPPRALPTPKIIHLDQISNVMGTVTTYF